MTQPLIANAILGIDTLWGGDVMCPSGTGRFIADSWFSDEPLPPAYTDPTAARVRESGGVSAKAPDRQAIEAYLAAVDVLGAIRGLKTEAAAMPGLRGEYLRGLALCFETMWDLAIEMLGKGAPVPYERCVEASIGQAPSQSEPTAKRERVAELLGRAGHASRTGDELLAAVNAWRKARFVPMAVIRGLGAAVIAQYDALSAAQLSPHLPAELETVPRANIPVLPMNTRAAALFEGIANNAILIAHGVTEVEQLPDDDLQIGVLLALLQDDAKNQASYLTWKDGVPQSEVAAILRRDFLVSPERADKLSGAWGRHPLLGRMYLPAYRAGTDRVAELRRRYPAERLLPVLYGCAGLVDVTTVESAL